MTCLLQNILMPAAKTQTYTTFGQYWSMTHFCPLNLDASWFHPPFWSAFIPMVAISQEQKAGLHWLNGSGCSPKSPVESNGIVVLWSKWCTYYQLLLFFVLLFLLLLLLVSSLLIYCCYYSYYHFYMTVYIRDKHRWMCTMCLPISGVSHERRALWEEPGIAMGEKQNWFIPSWRWLLFTI